MIAIRLLSALIFSSFVLSGSAFASPKNNWLKDQKSSSDRKAFCTDLANNYLWGDDRIQFDDNGLQNIRNKYEWSWYALKGFKIYKLSFVWNNEVSECKYVANTDLKTTLGFAPYKTITEVSKEGKNLVLYTQDVGGRTKTKRLVVRPKESTFDYVSTKCDKYPFKRTKPAPPNSSSVIPILTGALNRGFGLNFPIEPYPRLACYRHALDLSLYLHPSYRQIMHGSTN